MPTVHLTTTPGLEDVAADELRWRLPGVAVAAELRPHGLAGHLVAAADHPALVEVAAGLTAVNRAVRPVWEGPLPGDGAVTALRRRFADLAPGLPELAPPDVAFRVRCRRTGDHPFTSEDVERACGAGVRDAVPRAVRLTGPAVELRCDVRAAWVTIGVEVPRSARTELPWRPSTSLRPQLAWGLLALGRPFDGPGAGVVLDPFAGGGTVLLQAAARWPGARLLGSDLHDRCVVGARANLAAVGAADRSVVREGDARDLAAVWPDERPDTLVTNPPFGERLGRSLDLDALYHALLAGAAAVAAPDARLVVLARRRGAFNRALRAEGSWDTRHVRIVELGGLYAGAFVLGPR